MAKYFDEGGLRYRVKKYKPDKKLKLGTAYIIDKYILPYRGEFKTRKECYELGVGIYNCKEDSEIIIIKPIGIKLPKKYSKSKAYELDKDYIKQIIIDEDITSELDDDDVIELDSGDIFAPEIKDTDNIFQMIVKDILRRKNIDLKQYSNRFESATMMGNWKRALLNHGMGTERFIEWLNLLDVDFDIVYKDKKGCAYPMGGEFHSKDEFDM